MSVRHLAACWLLAVLVTAPAMAAVRFAGLERLYFERMDATRAPWQATATLRELLPQQLADDERVVASGMDADADGEFHVRDIALPVAGTAGALWLREVEDARHPRISALWWALYQDGERGDVWFYSAMPERTEGKLLGNYAIESVRALAADSLLLRLRSRMLRPGGAWWTAGRELVFDVRGAAITLVRVHTPWAYTHGYDSGDAEGGLTVATEREHEQTFALRRRDHATAEQLAACGMPDPEAISDLTASWATLDRAANCITAGPDAITSTRAFGEPSFAERGRVE